VPLRAFGWSVRRRWAREKCWQGREKRKEVEKVERATSLSGGGAAAAAAEGLLKRENNAQSLGAGELA